jgi:hypothetical protein
MKRVGNKRKIREVDRIKEEEKRDRLAICKEKKKRYGIKTMNKEERKSMKQRTEERIIISQAKANSWKRYRSRGEGEEEERENEEAWRSLRVGILALEEEGGWIWIHWALKGWRSQAWQNLPDKVVAEGRVDDDIVGQGTDRDGLQDRVKDDKEVGQDEAMDEVVDDNKKEGVEDKYVREEVLVTEMAKKWCCFGF